MPIVAGVDFGTLSVRVTLLDSATQSHFDQMQALVKATRDVLAQTQVDGEQVVALALDPRCDHRAHKEAQRITALAHSEGLEAIDWCGGVYSPEWGGAKLLYWLRHNLQKRRSFATALEHCDMVAAKLSGINDPAAVTRSVCATGHKWMWNQRWGGLPRQEFLSKLDPLFDGIRAILEGNDKTSDAVAGHLSAVWAHQMGLRTGIPIPVGAFDAH